MRPRKIFLPKHTNQYYPDGNDLLEHANYQSDWYHRIIRNFSMYLYKKEHLRNTVIKTGDITETRNKRVPNPNTESSFYDMGDITKYHDRRGNPINKPDELQEKKVWEQIDRLAQSSMSFKRVSR